MNVYKTKTTGINALTKENFEIDTDKNPPYYKSEDVQYAICPACENPIQILGLYKTLAHTKIPYAKHFCQDVPNLTTYNQENYDYCIYANPKYHDKQARRKSAEGAPSVILTLIRDEFHAIVRYIKNVTGILISPKFACGLLESYLGMDGHMYTGANLINYPLMVAYMTPAQGIYGQYLARDSALMLAIQRKEPEFLRDNRIMPKAHINIYCTFIHHKIAEGKETLKYRVLAEKDLKDYVLYEEIIVFDPMEYKKLLNSPLSEKDLQLLELASKMIN